MGFNKRLFVGGASGITPSDNFAVNIWSGDGGTNRNIPTGFNLQSNGGVVWIKKRSGSGGSDHILMDSVRGVSNFIYPNDSAQEVANGGSTHNQLKTFDSDGFSVAQSAYTNASGSTYVAWSFLGGGAASSNGNGSITSSVSANVEAGFSIVTYSGASTTSTVGHGLSSAPELIIVKGRNVVAGWPTLYNDGSNSYTVRLSENGANDNANKNLMFGNGSSHTAPTSSVFTVGNSDETNQGYNYVAYCIHSVAGYSKVGTFNASGSEQFIDVGFTPRWLMIKKVTSSGNWGITDSVRSAGSVPYCIYNNIYADTADLEGVSASNCNASYVQYTSTGFGWSAAQISAGTNPNYWESGQTFIYLAYA